VTSDCRYAEDNYATHADAKRAMDGFCYRLAKYIGAYMAVLGDDHLDAIVFTGGIGENAGLVRELTLNYLKLFGIKVDSEKNTAARFGKSGEITAADSAFRAFVIPTNEELVIAQDTACLAL
ncbi:acetate kinase, partial [Glaesserella parasuis]|nr:acetate kinase [Glaesserella parasuis]